MDSKAYAKMTDARAPRSPIWKNLLMAFLVGGAICTVGQAIGNFYRWLGLDSADSGTATSVTLIFLGALCTGLGFYDRIGKVGGAGSLVPISGFANAIVSAALEYKSEGFVTGMSAKMFVIAGPVLVFGISGSVVYGLILCLMQLL